MSEIGSNVLLLPLGANVKNVADGKRAAAERNFDEGEALNTETPDVCRQCRQPITWMRTCYGFTSLPFDPDPVPRALDPGQEGWIPGRWSAKGRSRTVLAPLRRYRPERQRQAGRVIFLHRCVAPQHRAALIREGFVA